MTDVALFEDALERKDTHAIALYTGMLVACVRDEKVLRRLCREMAIGVRDRTGSWYCDLVGRAMCRVLDFNATAGDLDDADKEGRLPWEVVWMGTAQLVSKEPQERVTEYWEKLADTIIELFKIRDAGPEQGKSEQQGEEPCPEKPDTTS